MATTVAAVAGKPTDASAASQPRFLAAEQLEKHPEFSHVAWTLEADKSGFVDVAKGRGGPFPICYEIHGHGPKHVVWVMGLRETKRGWQRQTKDFGHLKADEYTCLVFDNRGVGDSGKPFMRYSTSEMAKDTVELLDHVGWTGKRELHVVGISMGGMISQELALLIPDRIASLSLVSTSCELKRTIGFFENLRNRINMLRPRPIDDQLAGSRDILFSQKWLSSPDDSEYTVEPFPTNGDRCAAGELSKRTNPVKYPMGGFIMQIIAAGWHKKSFKALAEIGDKVGRERIMVIHGVKDRMITFPHAEDLLAGLGGEDKGITTHFEPEQGHVIPLEMRKTFMSWIEDFVQKTQAMQSK